MLVNFDGTAAEYTAVTENCESVENIAAEQKTVMKQVEKPLAYKMKQQLMQVVLE